MRAGFLRDFRADDVSSCLGLGLFETLMESRWLYTCIIPTFFFDGCGFYKESWLCVARSLFMHKSNINVNKYREYITRFLYESIRIYRNKRGFIICKKILIIEIRTCASYRKCINEGEVLKFLDNLDFNFRKKITKLVEILEFFFFTKHFTCRER